MALDQDERVKRLQLATDAIGILKDHGAYIHAVAQTGSIYITFAHERCGKLRIADHKGRAHLRYKWNVEIGGKDHISTKGTRTRYYSSEENAIQFFHYMKAEFDAEEKLRCSFATINKKP